jgi:hypothetical protein
MGNDPDATPLVFALASCNASGVCDVSGRGSAALGDNNGRSSVTEDGLSFYSCGTNGLELEACSPGAGCVATMIQDAVNFRALAIAGGGLFGTSQSKGFAGLVGFGGGLPRAATPAESIFNPVNEDGSKFEPQALKMLSNTTVLIADTSAKGAGGISLFSFVAGEWALNSSFAGTGHAHWFEYDACTGTVFFIADPAGAGAGDKFSPTTIASVPLSAAGVWGSAATVIATAQAGEQFMGLAMAPWTGGAGKCPPPPQ